ncbi:MAG: DUF3726 domain-containing protein [Rhodosalinus sp.]
MMLSHHDPAHNTSTPGADGAARVRLSLSEIEALCFKAARGAGLDWGEAEEAGWAAAWLSRAGLAGPTIILGLLKDLAALERPVPGPGRWEPRARAQCPLRTGIALADFAGRRLRREQMSMVFQHFALLPHRTVLENAGMARAVRGETRADYRDDALKWLDRVGLGGQGGQYPHQLSGGMQQRVGIARALASDSPVMLMDEAFSALDPLIRTDMQDLLLELQEELQKTVVFISHDLDEALKLADHLVILKDGRVVQQGEPQDILLHPADPYIVDFISDINRARVLRVRSVMEPGDAAEGPFAGEVGPDDTLESVIARSGGDTALRYRVERDGRALGVLHMQALVRALVPTGAAEGGLRARAV